MTELKLYNTLTRKKDVFKPLQKGTVSLYTCGPTVYWYQHIGNLRSYVFSDILKRVLAYNKYNVNHLINVTDVGHLTSDADDGEDKMEAAAVKEGKTASDIAQFYFTAFENDLKKLHILPPKKWLWATKHIKEQIQLIKQLEKNGFTYETEDGIYFDSSKFKTYGTFAKLNVKGLQAGKRISTGQKKNNTDFALWKFSDTPGKRQQEWESPWGLGFPGWHIECSAMSMKYFGEQFDIHTGGEDHVPVHHTNEIAQSEAATGRKPFVKYWLHGAFLLSKGEKVSKSKGGLYTLSELEEQGYNPMHYRYLCLLTHYRKQLNFTLETLDAAKNAYEKLYRKVSEIRTQQHKGTDRTKEYKTGFLKAINDDLNMPKALKILWDVVNDFDFTTRKKLQLLDQFDGVLGLGISEMKETVLDIPEPVKKLLEARVLAREKKQWVQSDILRDRIREHGFIVEDSPEGTVIRKA